MRSTGLEAVKMLPYWIIVFMIVPAVADNVPPIRQPHSAGDRHYDYESETEGPQHWEGNCKENVQTQSPININTHQAYKPERVPPLLFKNFDQELGNQTKLNHIGYTIMLYVDENFQKLPENAPTISGALMQGDASYWLYGISFHWGMNYTNGSEHTINYNQYAMESNWVFVHKDNSIKQGKISYEAARKNKDLVLLRLLYKISLYDNPAYVSIAEGIEELTKKQSTPIEISNLRSLLPKNLDRFWIYKGSETYYPCNQVQWVIVMEDLVPISEWQIHGVWKLNNWWKENQKINIAHRKPVAQRDYKSITYRSSGRINCACLLWVVLPLVWCLSGTVQLIG